MPESLLQQFDLSDKNVVVTGASSGIGLTLSRTLAQSGANVVLVARRIELLKKETEKMCRLGWSASWVAVDLLDRPAMMESHRRICQSFGAPQIVINAAGINLREPAQEVSFDSWDRTLNLNLGAPFFFARLFVEEMKQAGWGRIINLASLQSFRAFPNGIAYGASKGGIVQLTRAMAECWSSFGIMCNAIAPGFFKTALTAPVFENHQLSQSIADNTVVGRSGKMEDLQGPILFLASKASDYVTGQVLFVDGGFTAK